MPPREKLDVETPESREARLGSLFSSLAQPGTDADGGAPAFPLPPSRPHAMPESDVLARARAFLPLLASSNAELLARAAADPSSVDIERADGEHVAMDVGLGVFDVQGTPGAGLGPVVERDGAVWEAAAQAGDEEEEDDEEGSEGEDESDTTESSDEDDDDDEEDVDEDEVDAAADDSMDQDK
ncbi:uncharacterized protein LOC62_02G002969 [Vanrija pseudolonga]|uniref:Uncharacterized protein n=1 Tax=Vanrija pseudolonga TaxID=143232 RepID=A0AAF0Y9H5_9TREE|nr:hypothetical protein LOC62_02G002969 [Vanrija pseudolonga]